MDFQLVSRYFLPVLKIKICQRRLPVDRSSLLFPFKGQKDERERFRKGSRRVGAKRNIMGGKVRDFISGREKEHRFVRRFTGFIRSSFFEARSSCK
jgi:hypothetical protein